MSAQWDLVLLFYDKRHDLSLLAQHLGKPTDEEFEAMREIFYAEGLSVHEADWKLRKVFFPVPTPGPLVRAGVEAAVSYRRSPPRGAS